MSATLLLQERSQLIDPFIASTQAVFSMMLGCEAVVSDNSQSNLLSSSHDISGIVGLSGAVRGTVVISMHQDVACAAAEVFLGSRPTEMDADVHDTVGELTNMIGGNAKERMPIAGISLGLPTVISGRGHRVSFEPGAAIEVLRFETPWGPLSIEIGLQV